MATVSFSPDGQECIFYIEAYPNSYAMFTEIQNGKWTKPDRASFSKTRSVGEPAFSSNGTRIYFTSGEPVSSVGKFDLWYVERAVGGSWSAPVNIGNPVNSADDEFHPCILPDGTLYFTNNDGNIVKSQYQNGAYQLPVVLHEPINLSSNPIGKSWGDPYVAPDESYMIFKSNRNGGNGGFDNYISYRNPDTSWSSPINLGPEINSPQDETAGDISFDGKYLFFGREGKIFWVRADFIKSLR